MDEVLIWMFERTGRGHAVTRAECARLSTSDNKYTSDVDDRAE